MIFGYTMIEEITNEPLRWLANERKEIGLISFSMLDVLQTKCKSVLGVKLALEILIGKMFIFPSVYCTYAPDDSRNSR